MEGKKLRLCSFRDSYKWQNVLSVEVLRLLVMSGPEPLNPWLGEGTDKGYAKDFFKNPSKYFTKYNH